MKIQENVYMLSKKLLVVATAACLMSCTNGASAMSRAQVPSAPTAPAKTSPATVADPGSLAGGGFAEGRILGQRNGALLVNRLKQRTTDVLGCDGIESLQAALVKVTRSLKAPGHSADDLVAGFYSGYLSEVRKTIRELRQGCDVLDYSSGSFAGELFGAIACQSQSVSIEVLTELELEPLYTGWSGGSSEVQLGCLTTLTQTVTACTDGAELSTEIEALLSVSCSDESI
jgi:hypothetical protein